MTAVTHKKWRALRRAKPLKRVSPLKLEGARGRIVLDPDSSCRHCERAITADDHIAYVAYNRSMTARIHAFGVCRSCRVAYHTELLLDGHCRLMRYSTSGDQPAFTDLPVQPAWWNLIGWLGQWFMTSDDEVRRLRGKR
jgi:hypothetical protein